MAKKQKQVTEAQGAKITQDQNYWINEYEYFMDAIEGLKMSHAILYQMAEHSKNKIREFDPEWKSEND